MWRLSLTNFRSTTTVNSRNDFISYWMQGMANAFSPDRPVLTC
jgi:hypothetical protein